MCEILILYFLCKHVGDTLRNKGHDPIMYQVMTVIFWIVGEVGGAIAGAIIAAVATGDEEAGQAGAVLGALCGAASGAGLSFLIVNLIPARERYQAQRGPYASYGATGYFVPPQPGNPYAPPANPFADQPASSYAPAPPYTSVPQASAGIPEFKPSVQPRPVQFSCPNGHLLQDWSTSAGQPCQCPICGAAAMVPWT